MPRYFIRLSYKGKAYAGWQIQDNADSVQSKINKAISAISAEEILTMGCGRTDTGVHAKIFYAHFDVKQVINDEGKFLHQLNAVLPSDITVYELIKVDDNAHARYDAIKRSYEYYISLDKNPFLRDFTMNGFIKPDMDLMNLACPFLIKNTDFSAFSKSNTQVKTNVCNITVAEWKQSDQMLVFKISSDRFLRGMVRAIVGTMLDVGTGKIPPHAVGEIISGGNRSEAGVSVPACGLYLSGVEYKFLPVRIPGSFPLSV